MKRIMLIMAVTAALACGQEKQSAEQPNVELTVFLLTGAAQGQAADDVPQDLTSTIKQLHGVFAYKSYKLTESFVLRGRSSTSIAPRPASTDGILPGNGLRYHFGYNRLWLTGDPPRTIHVDGIDLNLNRPTSKEHSGVASINTDLDIRDGQKTVVGKSSVDSTGDALILVIVPKVVD
jgi:hypothetical protein